MQHSRPVDSNPARQGWRTSPKFVEHMKLRYYLNFDIAADSTNNVFPAFYDYSAGQDALKLPWPPGWFCNPPWNNIPPFVERAISEGTPGIMVVPGRVNTRWFFKAFQAQARFKFFVGRLAYLPPPGIKASSPRIESAVLAFGYPGDPWIEFLHAKEFNK